MSIRARAIWILLVLGASLHADPPTPDLAAATHQAISLVEQGRCTEALPMLERLMPRLTDKQLQYNAAMAEARCAMALDRESTAVEAMFRLKREFPNDPEVLFISVHYFSELAQRSAQQLAAKAPASVQARRLEAENFESQQNWDQAAGIYRGILKDAPNTPEIHYRLGQALLAKAGESGPTDEGRAEIEKERTVDPHNASAAVVLGERARRAGHWDDAAQHFARASNLDTGFSEAYLAQGMSLAAGGKFTEAIPPLEKYVKMEPTDPAGHYQLAVAYGRTGNRDGAAREMALKTQADEHARQNPSNAPGHPAQ
jgi:predicted Zn-dependent protease